MRTTVSYLRLLTLMVIGFFVIEWVSGTEEKWAVEEYPIIWAVLGIVLLIGIAAEIALAELKNILYRSLNSEQQKRWNELEEKDNLRLKVWMQKTYDKLVDRKPIEEEDEIILDHNYDGIRELDNKLPPWWLYSFYGTIIFAGIYLARYHIFDGASQEEEYRMEMAEAQAQIEEYKKTAPDLIDASTVELLTGQEDVDAGKSLYVTNCAACHKVDAGGGIGPNLTDDYWILGGGIKNVFNTISEGGRSGKGMIAWKTDLTPRQMAQVASYIISLHGVTPQEAKEPEGELWFDENARVDEVNVKEVDSTKMKIIMKDEPVGLDLEKEK